MKAEDRWKCSNKHPQYQCDEVAQVRAALWSQAIALLRGAPGNFNGRYETWLDYERRYREWQMQVRAYLEGGDETAP